MLALLMLVEAATATPVPMPAFLAGCWEEKRAEQSWTEECWTNTRGGLMIGSGRDGKGDSVRHWEWMRIERGADGDADLLRLAQRRGRRRVQGDSRPTASRSPSSTPPTIIRSASATSLTGDGLDAEVSLADGSKPNRWSYRR